MKARRTIGEFITTLRKISENCAFADPLNGMLLDGLVCGCNDHCLQCKLLSEDSLTFDKGEKRL